jgi:aspartate/methionine/tyrosine aminotransferase
MFSSRLPAVLSSNRFSRELARLRAEGARLLDLTETNSTRVGLAYPEMVTQTLADPRGRGYDPEPFGLADARRAVAGEFKRQGRPIAPERLVLTASTSEAYSLLFKLLCNPGDEVLVPQPSYPLFELLTRLDAVSAVPYPLEYHGVWSIDLAALESRVTGRTRAVLVVSPNNPTGSMLRRRDLDALAALSAERSIALIGDEVFLDYPLAPRDDAARVTDQGEALTFSLGGLSKSAGLPQMKLGWMSVTGPDALVTGALARLEVMCDTYLSVSTPVQIAAARLIAEGAAIRALIADRLATNLRALRDRLRGAPAITLLEPEGGWSAVLQVPATQPEEALVMCLLRDAHVVVHPGYFFDFPREAYLVVSLLPEPAVFNDGVQRIVQLAAGEASS